uniref:Uncharacterized protein n=1 Tax=Anguilla anguilla TaxID=7936 RepID=A0A0E9SC23_ANGAN
MAVPHLEICKSNLNPLNYKPSSPYQFYVFGFECEELLF